MGKVLEPSLGLRDALLAAFENAGEFDPEPYLEWLRTQPGDVQAIAKLVPPHRVYKMRDRLSYCYVHGYASGTKGGPAVAVVMLLGAGEAPPLGVTPDLLEPVIASDVNWAEL